MRHPRIRRAVLALAALLAAAVASAQADDAPRVATEVVDTE